MAGFIKSNKGNDKEKEINYEVVENYGTIMENANGYNLELRLVKWNGNEPKYDIRAWKKQDDGTEKMRKGLTLTGEEAENLYKLLKKIATGK